MQTLPVLAAALAVLLTVGATPAHASLIGQQVTGSIKFGSDPTNYFDPANGQVPAGYGNTSGQPVTIGNSQVEFGYQDDFNTDMANFTASQLIFTDVSLGGSAAVIASFTSAAPGAFGSLNLASSNVVGLTYSVAGNTISISYPAFQPDGTFTAMFNVNAVPEPASLLILGAGLAGLISLRRRQPETTA